MSYAEQLRSRLRNKLEGVEGEAYPNAIDIISLAEPLFKSGQTITADQISPVYLRDNVVS